MWQAKAGVCASRVRLVVVVGNGSIYIERIFKNWRKCSDECIKSSIGLYWMASSCGVVACLT